MHESDPFRVEAFGLPFPERKSDKPLLFITSIFILPNLIGRIQISHNWSVMREHKSLRLRKYSQLSAIILSGGMCLSSGGTAQALTADDLLNKMNSDEQTSYIAGMIGGFAHSRFLKDKPDQSGMSCIFDWFYGSGTTKWQLIETWFSRHLDKQVEPLLYVLIKKECGE